MKKITAKRQSFVVSACFSIFLILGFAINSFAQNSRNTDSNPDKILRSSARVNPSTLAMELSVPVGAYPGRAGNSMPINFNYTSKVWQMRDQGAFVYPSGTEGVAIVPMFAKRSAAGWTSSIGVPAIEYRYDVYLSGSSQYDFYEGQIWTNEASLPFGVSFPTYYMKRLRVTMPDGSSHEMRASDTPVECGTTSQGCSNFDWTGTYLSVDDSRMRLEEGSGTAILYMADGSRYLFGSGTQDYDYVGRFATTYIDAHGNRSTYNITNKQWTDTMGRVFTNPLPGNYNSYYQAQTVGDPTVTLPGIGTGTTNVTLSWRYLKDPNGGESGLTNPSQNLAYQSDFFCNGSYYQTISGTPLFVNGSYGTRICNFGTSAVPNYPGPTFNPIVLTKITLANGSAYQFKYNLHGEIEKIIYPTGGYERFVYAVIPPTQLTATNYDTTNRGVIDRWVSVKGDGTDEVHSTYSASRSYNNPPPGTTDPYKVTITNPDYTRTEQLIYDEISINAQRPYGFDNAKTGLPYEDRVYSSANVLLRRHLTSHTVTGPLSGGFTGATRDVRPEKEISIIFEPGNSYALVQMSETVYDTSGNSDPAYFSALNPKQTKTYHYAALNATTAAGASFNTLAALFSSANLATVKEADYLYDADYKTRNIAGLTTETRIKDAAGNVKAKSQVSYDESSYSLASSGSMPTAAANSWVDLTSSTELGTVLGSKRGLPTSVRSFYDIANSQYIETHTFYDQFGNARKSRDGRGKDSELIFDDDYAFAYPTSSIAVAADANGTYGSDTGFTSSTTYDYNTGLSLTVTDANGQTTQMSYSDPVTNVIDPLFRLRKTTAPSGQQTITDYGVPDTSGSTSGQLPSGQRFVKVKTQLDANYWKEGYTWFDGLGRTTKSQTIDANGDIFTETEYDNMGRVKRTTNPFRTGETKQWTTPTYDDLGRTTVVTLPDSATVQTAYGISSSSPIGLTNTVTDEALRKRSSISDAFGRMTRVIEDPTGQNLATDYLFDTLGNLRKTTQGNQYRYFMYDDLSRLIYAKQPEQEANTAFSVTDSATGNNQWSVKYEYDANGNVTKTTDAKNVYVEVTYDNLNRPTYRNYSDSTPDATFYYDGTGLGSVPNYSKGKITKVTSSVSENRYTSFDNMGRALASQQITDGQTYDFGYQYNLSGALIEETYPSTRKVKSSLDSDGTLSMVQSRKNSSFGYYTYAIGFDYNSDGSPKKMRLGNGHWETYLYNNRLQPTRIALGKTDAVQDILKLEFAYGQWESGTLNTGKNNGSLAQQIITVPTVGSTNGFTATQKYTYDGLNRIESAAETVSSSQTWKQTFTYDRYGNRNFDEANTTTLPKNCSSGTQVCPADRKVLNPSIAAGTNRINLDQDGDSQNDYLFDKSGNTTKDAEGRTFIYDADNKQTEVKDSQNNSIGQYFYDGDGMRVKKYVPSTGETTIFVYDIGGKMVAEYSTIVANQTDAKVSYLTNDHLGSPRINTDQNGAVISRHDYQPFGEEIARASYGMDTVRKQFTGYERDIESSLDFAQARYYNLNHGRFTSPDPMLSSGRIGNPQTWNRYAYVLNNPLSLIDPEGLYECKGSSDECKTFRENFAKAQAQLAEIEKKYGKDSDEYRKAVRSLNSYGCESKGGSCVNGDGKFINADGEVVADKKDAAADTASNVQVSFDWTGQSAAHTSTDTSTGIIKIRFGKGKDSSLGLIANEGIDTANFQDALKTGVTVPQFESDKDGLFVQAVFGEIVASSRNSVSAYFNLSNNQTVNYWEKAWESTDHVTVRSKRNAAINKVLLDNYKHKPLVTFPKGYKPKP